MTYQATFNPKTGVMDYPQCVECGVDLGNYALYHEDGAGPFCHSCVDPPISRLTNKGEKEKG